VVVKVMNEAVLGRPAAALRTATAAHHARPAPGGRIRVASLNQSAGAVSIAESAADTGWSARHLDTRFRHEVGLTPAESARVIRFDRAPRRLAMFSDLASAASDYGYFDQSHRARELTALASCSPTPLMGE
jgi:AraC-like DNA-binding protein